MPQPLRRVALLVEYDGTELSGSQFQPGRRTVQGVIEDALRAYDGAADAAGVRVALAGRTDAGVHARGQVAAVSLARRDGLATVREALNRRLPADVAVRAAAEAPPAFGPRHDARARRYRYRIADGRPRSPLTRRERWQVARRLDARAMAAAAALLPRGRRDWSAFAGPLAGGRSPLRTLLRLEVAREADGGIAIAMEADAFLPHQVRRTAGALERVGAGALAPAAFAALAGGGAGSAGPAAPPHGLTLEAVRYEAGLLAWDGPVEADEAARETAA